jgi:hypothetical protein
MKKIVVVGLLLTVALLIMGASYKTPVFMGQETLLSVSNIDLSKDGDTSIFIVPKRHRCVLTKAVLVVGSNAGMTYFSIGQDGAETDFVENKILRDLNSQYDTLTQFASSPVTGIGKAYSAGTVIKALISRAEGGNKNTLFLYGILY